VGKISVVINTLNEADTLERAIKSVKWADEILVCDMHSDDGSGELAKKLGAKVVEHERVNFVEPARNFAVSKASNEWILILDPDEEISAELAKELRRIADEDDGISFVKIPRKNLIFNKWMKASMWWPDYNIRFFKKGSVKWSDKIHRQPTTEGKGLDLPESAEVAIIHHHYDGISQYLNRLNRYTDVQAMELVKDGYKFSWSDLISKPLGEFLSRFFANRGFDDGLHGLALGLLQSFSFLVMYLKAWELEKFKESEINLKEIKSLTKKSGQEIDYWFKYSNLSRNPLKRFVQKASNKLR
jgi:glycosyltransferase involved in cell wall biosynthesis